MNHHIHVSPLDLASKEDKAWLAGLLEGEGCFFASKNRTRMGRSVGELGLSMTDRDIVERAARLMGTTVRLLPGRRSPWQTQDQYQTAATGVRARRAMEEVLPYLGHRRAAKVVSILSMGNWGFPDSHKVNKPTKADYIRAGK